MLYGYLNSPFVSNPFADAAIPPKSLTSPVISGSGIVGQTLSTTDGTWSGTLPITYTYQWNRNGSIILGATFNTYTLVTADASTSITCTVTATNAGGSLSKNSNAISVAAAGDADAQAFITAAAITDTTQKAAIDKLVTDLKGYGIWTKMKALYPFIGGTAAQHKFNLRNPLDTDAAFRLVFNGGWTHSSTGALPNGTNGYANTFFIPKNNFTSNINRHLSIYLRTNNIQGGDRIDMGSFDNESGQPGFGNDFLSSNNAGNVGGQLSSTNILFPMPDRRGMSLISKINANQSVFKNGVNKATTSGTGNSTSDLPVFIGGMNLFGFFPYAATNNEFGFSSIGDGLTDTEVTNLYTAVQTFQTTLGRNV